MDIPSQFGINKTDFRVVIGRTKIDYDIDKEEANREEHNYSLESAVYLLDKWLLPVCSTPFITKPVKENNEIRHAHMGVDDDGNVVFMVTTMRPNETVRIISVRRASEKERNDFYSLTGFVSTVK